MFSPVARLPRFLLANARPLTAEPPCNSSPEGRVFCTATASVGDGVNSSRWAGKPNRIIYRRADFDEGLRAYVSEIANTRRRLWYTLPTAKGFIVQSGVSFGVSSFCNSSQLGVFRCGEGCW